MYIHLICQLLPELGDGGVCLLLQGGEGLLEVAHLVGQLGHLGQELVQQGVRSSCSFFVTIVRARIAGQ